MTVAELIKALQEMPQDAEVMVWNDYYCCNELVQEVHSFRGQRVVIYGKES